jgi:toxin ParE1/3/4
VTYRFSRKADEDLENLYITGAREFGVAQAERYYTGLVEALEFLASYPRAARARPELGPETRGHPYKAHMIFYRPDGADIFIQRIRHGSEDWQAGDAPE